MVDQTLLTLEKLESAMHLIAGPIYPVHKPDLLIVHTPEHPDRLPTHLYGIPLKHSPAVAKGEMYFVDSRFFDWPIR